VIPEGQTARLLLRPLELADAAEIQRLFPQWDIVKYLAARVPWPYPPDGAEQFLRGGALEKMTAGEAWYWTLRLLADPDRIIGAISLELGEDENRGFWILPEHRGKGLMTEACNWVNDFWFDTLGQRRLRAPKAVANAASRRISEKQGMRVIRTEDRDYVSGRLPTEIWEITADEWRAWKASQAASPQALPTKHRHSVPWPISKPPRVSPRPRRG